MPPPPRPPKGPPPASRPTRRASPTRAARRCSTYPWQRLAFRLCQQSRSETGVQDDRAGALGDAGADDRRISTERMRAQHFHQPLRIFGTHADHGLSFVCDDQRIDAVALCELIDPGAEADTLHDPANLD